MIFPLAKAPATGEIAWLQRLQQAGIPVAPTVALVGLEEEFYRLNNLAEQIRKAFSAVFGARLDEEKLEAACAFAEKLLRESYMLPERSDEVKQALPEGRLLVRYAGEAPFTVEPGKQEALWALKRLWASRWQVDAVLDRSPNSGANLAPPEVPSLIQAVRDDLETDEALSQKASEILGQTVRVWTSEGLAVRVG